MNASIIIQNLKCGGCAHTVTSKLSEIEGLQNVQVNVEDSLVTFQYINETQIAQAKLKLKSLGYPELDQANSMITKAKSYISCATGKISKS